MAMSAGGGGGGNLSEINVTPLVDVLLVLLVIFMVTAPMLHHGAEVPTPEVPEKNTSEPPPKDDKKTTVFMDQQGKISYRDKPVADLTALATVLKADTELQKSGELYLQADVKLKYRVVMKVIGTIRKAGIKKIGMVVDPDDLAGLIPPQPAKKKK